MQPGKLNLTVYKGSTKTVVIRWGAGSTTTPVNLTGYKARMQVRKRVTDPVVLDELTTENSRIVITDAVNGELELRFPAATSTAYEFTTAVYDLELVEPDNITVHRILEGIFTASPEVTR